MATSLTASPGSGEKKEEGEGEVPPARPRCMLRAMNSETLRPLAKAGPGAAADRFPFDPFPRSWYLVAWSDELPPGAVLPLTYFGRELVLFRTAEAEGQGQGRGRAVVLDAYCPHLGAHLGHGGVVCGETLQCPFHGWRFDAAGQCVKVPHAGRVPPLAETRAWPVHETNGMILVYYDPEGAAPGWTVPEIPEVGGPGAGPGDGLVAGRAAALAGAHARQGHQREQLRPGASFVHARARGGGLERRDGRARDARAPRLQGGDEPHRHAGHGVRWRGGGHAHGARGAAAAASDRWSRGCS